MDTEFTKKKKKFTSFKRESELHWLMEHSWFVSIDSELRDRKKSAWKASLSTKSIKIKTWITPPFFSDWPKKLHILLGKQVFPS